MIADGEQGLLVPARDPPALAAALVDLIDHPDRARALAEAGRRKVEQAFTVQATVEGTIAEYESLLASR